jgi:DNA repair protein RecN (Recombination protein N)
VIVELRIQDLGVIASATVAPGPGFTALTGETGAGKTMVLTALEMLLGGRVDSAIAQSASIEGVWEVDADHRVVHTVSVAGGLCDDGEIVLSRSANKGRLRAFAGGRMVPASLLAQIGEDLITVHGQATQQRLRGPAAQRSALDRFGPVAHQALLEDHLNAYRGWRDDAGALETARTGQQAAQQRMVFLRSALEEIERIDPQPGEGAELAAEVSRLSNLAEISSATAQVRSALLGADDPDVGCATDLLHGAARELVGVAAADPELARLHERLLACAEEAADIGREVAAYADGLNDDPGRLDWLNNRIHDLRTLTSRYGDTESEVLQWAQTAAAELTGLEQGSDIEALQERERRSRQALAELTSALTASRRGLAEELAKRATAELQQLAMPNAAFTIAVEPGELGADGADDVRFLLAAHPGATPAPIGKAASGGELSRIMLALEVVLADTDSVGTFVFDEVDAGVGGAAATAIGRRLAALAEHAQVIVVTHMPQVAAFAGTHLRVLKQQDRGVTTSDVRELDADERVVEIARMLAGQEDSEHAREHARELLAMRA